MTSDDYVAPDWTPEQRAIAALLWENRAVLTEAKRERQRLAQDCTCPDEWTAHGPMCPRNRARHELLSAIEASVVSFANETSTPSDLLGAVGLTEPLRRRGFHRTADLVAAVWEREDGNDDDVPVLS